jgi:hypothetical protein
MAEQDTGQQSGPPRFEYPDGEMGSAVFLGDVTDRSVRVWVRAPEGDDEAALFVGGQEVDRRRVATEPNHDHIGAVVLEADGAAGEVFEVLVGESARSHRFAPATGSPAAFSFLFGSCHQPFDEEQDAGRLRKHGGAGIYPHVIDLARERQPAFALWLGDQVYSDGIAGLSVREQMARDGSITDAELLDTYRHLYRGYFNESGHRRLAEAVPAYLMWDDHDIFDGWGSLIDHTPFDRRVYGAAAAAYAEYQHLRNPGGDLDGGPPFGYSFWYGDVGFHVPDLRAERDFHQHRVLGDRGWELLDGFFADATSREAATVFLALSVPLVHASPTIVRALEWLRTAHGRDVRDRWTVEAFAAQRSELLERIFGWQSERPERQVIVLSGDVHVGAAFSVRARAGAGRFAQWTSSSLTTPIELKHVLANRMATAGVRLGEREMHVWSRGLVTRNNVGLVQVSPAEGGGHEARLEIHEHRPGGLRLALQDRRRPRAAS